MNSPKTLDPKSPSSKWWVALAFVLTVVAAVYFYEEDAQPFSSVSSSREIPTSSNVIIAASVDPPVNSPYKIVSYLPPRVRGPDGNVVEGTMESHVEDAITQTLRREFQLKAVLQRARFSSAGIVMVRAATGEYLEPVTFLVNRATHQVFKVDAVDAPNVLSPRPHRPPSSKSIHIQDVVPGEHVYPAELEPLLTELDGVFRAKQRKADLQRGVDSSRAR